jgi:hypothetical protein
VGELKRLLRSLVRDVPAKDTKGHRPSGGRNRISWHTALLPRWLPWQQARLPWGGFIAIALSLPEAGQQDDVVLPSLRMMPERDPTYRGGACDVE